MSPGKAAPNPLKIKQNKDLFAAMRLAVTAAKRVK